MKWIGPNITKNTAIRAMKWIGPNITKKHSYRSPHGSELWAQRLWKEDYHLICIKYHQFELRCQHRTQHIHYSCHVSSCELWKCIWKHWISEINSNTLAMSQGLNIKQIAAMLYVLPFKVPRLAGKDLEGNQDRHGLELLKMIWNLPAWACTPRGDEHKIELTEGISWRK